jgi:SOS-response transcriptional repressor LexA
MIGLTPTQRRLLDFIQRYQAENGIAPTFAEMQLAAGQSSKSGVFRLLISLEERGYIRRLHGRARAIELLNPGQAGAAEVVRLLRALSRDELREILAQTVGLLAHFDGVPETALMLHRLGDKLPRKAA